MNEITLDYLKSLFSDIKLECVVREEFDGLGLVNQTHYNSFITYALKSAFYKQALSNNNVEAIITTKDVFEDDSLDSKLKTIILCEDPNKIFVSLHNHLYEETTFYKSYVTYKIPDCCKIARSAIVEGGVKMGKNCIIKDNVILKAGTVLGDNVVVREGAIIGPEISEERIIDNKYVAVRHDSFVSIGNDTIVGVGTVVARGLFGLPTRIGERCRICDKVFIAHGGRVGNDSYIASGSNISGSVTVGNKVWIGPGVLVTNGTTIGDNANVTLGAVVATNVQSGARVAGHFAIDHVKFMKKWTKDRT
jgi:UDP-3-O-[3-hydroxymyristoyl] glucosamine N-acyltransferase